MGNFKIKSKILAFFAIVAMSVIGSAKAETWECAIIGATQKVILTQESDPALSDSRYVPGTVTGPYGKKHTAKVSIDGFDRRWDYITADKIGVYAIFMGPSGQTGFYDFSNLGEGETRKQEQQLFCEDSKAKEKREAEELKEEELKARLKAEEDQPRLTTLADAYILAIRLKVERNWKKPGEVVNTPACEVHVVQGPGGIILDVKFGACAGTAAYRASIENAIYKAEPLPGPGDPALFERELTFTFSPDQY